MSLQSVYPAMATANLTMIRLANGTVARSDTNKLTAWYDRYQDRLDDRDVNLEWLQSVGPNPATALDVLDVQPGDPGQWLLILSDVESGSRSVSMTTAEMRAILEPRS
jgi:hypothetical protein